jgi:hypothetical protein
MEAVDDPSRKGPHHPPVLNRLAHEDVNHCTAGELGLVLVPRS